MNRAFSAALAVTLGLVCAACRQASYESRRGWGDDELERVAIVDTTVMSREMPDGPGRHELALGAEGEADVLTVVATKWGRMASFAIGAKDGATLISLVFPGKE